MISESRFEDDFNEINDCAISPSYDEITFINKTIKTTYSDLLSNKKIFLLASFKNLPGVQ